jgi:hypothetical protein
MRDLIVRFLNLVTRNSGPDAYEWSNQQIVFFLILWPESLVAGAVVLYGLYENLVRDSERGFRYIIVGVAASVTLGFLAMFVGRFLKRVG